MTAPSLFIRTTHLLIQGCDLGLVILVGLKIQPSWSSVTLIISSPNLILSFSQTFIDRSFLYVAYKALWLSPFCPQLEINHYILSFTFSNASMSLSRNHINSIPQIFFQLPRAITYLHLSTRGNFRVNACF